MPGDHAGQTSHGYRFPYGPVAIISPFNFPMEIPLLQIMGALYMGNKVVFKGDSKVSVVMEQVRPPVLTRPPPIAPTVVHTDGGSA